MKDSTNSEKVNVKETIDSDRYSKYNNMDENKQLDVGEEICMNMCWDGSNKCMSHGDDNEFLGVDVVKIRDDYENCRKDKFHRENVNTIVQKLKR